MPTILVSEKSTSITIEIIEYDKYPKDDFSWCDIKIEIKNKYFNYSCISEFLDVKEIDFMINWLSKAIINKLPDEDELYFTEPELVFIFNKTKDEKPYLDFEFNYPSNGCYGYEKWCTLIEYEQIIELRDGLIKEQKNFIENK